MKCSSNRSAFYFQFFQKSPKFAEKSWGRVPETPAPLLFKSWIRPWLLKITNLSIAHVHILELQKFFHFCAAHSPVRLDIETKFLISNY